MRPPPLRRFEAGGWIAICIALIVVRVMLVGGPRLSTDSYQYLSIADHIVAGDGISTSLIHFVTERQHGVIPAPATIFPAGLPMAMAALQLFGISGENAGLLISALATVASMLLLLAAARWLTFTPFATRIMLALWLGNSWVPFFGFSVMSEALFSTLTLAGVVLFVRAEAVSLSRRQLVVTLVLAQICIGAGYWVRHAGLFLFAAAGLFFLFNFLVRRTRESFRSAAFMSISGLMIALFVVRNLVFIGNWQGRIEGPLPPNPRGPLLSVASGVQDLLLGGVVPVQFGLAELLLVGGGLVGVLLAGQQLAVDGWGRTRKEHRSAFLLLIMFVAVFAGGMIYVVVSAGIWGARYIFPMWAPVTILIGLVVTRSEDSLESVVKRKRMFVAGLAIAAGAYVFIHARNFGPLDELIQNTARHRVVANALAAPVGEGETLNDWLERSVSPDAVIVANEGQALGYVLQRSVVSIDSEGDELDVQGVRAEMEMFEADYVIAFLSETPGPTGGDSFVDVIDRGELPAGLDLVAENGRAKVFQKR